MNFRERCTFNAVNALMLSSNPTVFHYEFPVLKKPHRFVFSHRQPSVVSINYLEENFTRENNLSWKVETYQKEVVKFSNLPPSPSSPPPSSSYHCFLPLWFFVPKVKSKKRNRLWIIVVFSWKTSGFFIRPSIILNVNYPEETSDNHQINFSWFPNLKEITSI